MKSILILLFLSFGLYAQKNVNKSYDTKLLFGARNNSVTNTTETVTYSSTEGSQVTVTDADTLYTIEFTECGIGNERISAMIDTTSGTTKVYIDLGLRS